MPRPSKVITLLFNIYVVTLKSMNQEKLRMGFRCPDCGRWERSLKRVSFRAAQIGIAPGGALTSRRGNAHAKMTRNR